MFVDRWIEWIGWMENDDENGDRMGFFWIPNLFGWLLYLGLICVYVIIYIIYIYIIYIYIIIYLLPFTLFFLFDISIRGIDVAMCLIDDVRKRMDVLDEG